MQNLSKYGIYDKVYGFQKYITKLVTCTLIDQFLGWVKLGWNSAHSPHGSKPCHRGGS